MSYIVETVEEFFSKLDKMQNDLAKFSQNLDSRSARIPELLKDFESALFSQMQDKRPAGKNAVELAARKSLDNVRAVIETWREKIEADRKGREFIKKNEKYLVVMIFGAVKAGKSSLGNFFAGKKFVNASFDNPYKHIPRPIFETEERGRDMGDVEKDERGDTWFSEGVIDTTGAIQYFTLSGLRWVDSPGTGAVGKSGDTKNMTKLVEEYLSYTDMCIFLMNSSEPGLQDDMRYMQKLSKEGQEALVVITKSDFQEEDIDESGNLISVSMPKSPENRKLQEDDICRRIQVRYPEIDASRFRAISISTLLAGQALESEDDEKFRASNIDRLMKILGDKVGEGAIERKQTNPCRLLNNFIDSIIDGLAQFDADIDEMATAIHRYKTEMDSLAKIIVTNVKREVRAEVVQRSYEWNSHVKRGKSIENATISDTVSQILQSKLNEEINAQMKRVVEDYESREMPAVKASLTASALKKKTVTISHTYTDSYTVPRPPSGLWETFRSWFGKEYYRVQHSQRTEQQTVDVGTNLDEFMGNLMPQVEDFAQKQAKASLESLRDNYFAEREAFAQDMRHAVEKLRGELSALKF